MWNQPRWMVALSFSLAVAAAAPATARGQDEPKEPAATVEGLPKPETVPPFNILPTLPTTPVHDRALRTGGPGTYFRWRRSRP